MNTLKLITVTLFVVILNQCSLNAQTIKPIAQMVHTRMGKMQAPTSRVFKEVSQVLGTEISKTVKKGTLVTLNSESLNALMAQKPSLLSLNIPFDGQELNLDLVEVPNLTEDFSVKTNTSNNQPVGYEKGVYYRGIIQGDDESLVAISFFKKEVFGVISNAKYGDIVVGKMEGDNNHGQYIIYSDRDLQKTPEFKCGEQETAQQNSDIKSASAMAPTVGGCVRVYFELDYGSFINKGSNLTTATNYITACFNNVAALYANESISTRLSGVYIWQTPDTYPVAGGTPALSALQAARPTFNGDLAHLVSIRPGPGYSGIAWGFPNPPYTTLCSTSKYAYSQIASTFSNVPTYSWSVKVITHEMGHNLGSPHTQSCSWPGGAIDGCVPVEGGTCARPALPPLGSGTIMSYCHQVPSVGVNLSNGFGPLPGARIRTAITYANCLSASCGTAVCAAPMVPSVSVITATTAKVSWTAVAGITNYRVTYKENAATTWTTVNTTATSLNLSALAPSTLYNVQVYSVCDATNTSIASPMANFTTSKCIVAAPKVPVVSAITSNTATVSWTAAVGAVGYRVVYKASLAASPSTVDVTVPSINLTNLPPLSAVNVRIFSLCGTNTLSPDSAVVNFTTTACVVSAPTNISVSPILQTTATVNWTPALNALFYRVEYKLSTATTWLVATATSPTTTLTGLTSATLYNVRITSYCSTTSKSAASPINNFTTANCAAITPAAPLVSAITKTTATISWTAVVGAVSYLVEYKPNASTVWTSLARTTNSANLISLTANTLYNVRIYSFCSATAKSLASVQSNFTTLVGTGASLQGLDFNSSVNYKNDDDMLRLSLFPNPAKNLVNLKILATEEGEYNVDFYDMIGKKVIFRKTQLLEGENVLPVPAENLVRGIYLVRVFKGKEAVTEKLIIE